MTRTIIAVIASLALLGYAKAGENNHTTSGRTHMSKQYIRDNHFRTIGSIDTESSGKQRAYDAHFRQVGMYGPGS